MLARSVSRGSRLFLALKNLRNVFREVYYYPSFLTNHPRTGSLEQLRVVVLWPVGRGSGVA